MLRRPLPSLLWLSLACACRPAATESPTAGEPRAAAAAGSDVPATPAAADAIDDGPGTIAGDAIDRVTARGPGWLLGQLGPPEPYRPRGRFEGWTITAVFPDAPELCAPRCDLQPGDVIVSVEGDTLETPNAYAAVFERASELSTLRVVRIRGGVRETVEYRIVRPPLPAGDAPG